ncbi:MAG: ATP-dependent acyl-CoA ligase, partial [Gammaproteobacteria bacterium]
MTATKINDANHADPRVLPREQCVLRYALDRWADERGSQVYAVFEDGREWTYAEVRTRTLKLAAGLASLGVAQGDHVAMWLPNGSDSMIAFFAINYLGAVYVPMNTAYKGRILEHVIENSDAEVIIAHGSLTPRLKDIVLSRLSTVVIAGEGAAPEGLRKVSFAEIAENRASVPELERPIEPWHTQSIIYTSGTTGPSKGVLSSYLHMYTNPGPEAWPMVTGEDRFLVNMPMFHIGGMGLCFAMLARGGSVAMMENFATATFWDVVSRTRCTAIFLLGAMATFLLKEAPH